MRTFKPFKPILKLFINKFSPISLKMDKFPPPHLECWTYFTPGSISSHMKKKTIASYQKVLLNSFNILVGAAGLIVSLFIFTWDCLNVESENVISSFTVRKNARGDFDEDSESNEQVVSVLRITLVDWIQVYSTL